MEVIRFKMIYEKYDNEKDKKLSSFLYKEKRIKEEMKSGKLRILGDNFMKYNKNKAKLIINNKKYKLNEFINNEEIKDDKIKIGMIFIKNLSHFSHMFKNCVKLQEIFNYNDKITEDDGEFQEFVNNIIYNTNYYEDNSEVNNYKIKLVLKDDDIYQNYTKSKTSEDKEISLN